MGWIGVVWVSQCLTLWIFDSPLSADGNSRHPSSCTSNPENTLHCLLLGNRNQKSLYPIYGGDWEHWYTSVCIVYVYHEPQGSTRFSIAILY